MKLANIEASVLSIPFRQSFKHASAERMQTQTLWVRSRTEEGIEGYGEGCPREYVSHESLASAMAFVERHRGDWLTQIGNVDDLREWVALHAAEIDANPAAWCAVELSLLDALGKAQGCSVERLLGLPELAGEFAYTAVLGDAGAAAFQAQLERYLQAGFRHFKIKLSGVLETDAGKVAMLTAAGVSSDRVRADANNLWDEAETAIAHMRALGFFRMGLEEPLLTGNRRGLQAVAEALGLRIILDESLLRTEQLEGFAADPERWIVNLRISKMGGLLRSLALVAATRQAGLRVVVGAHVGETSLLTRAALTAATAVGDILLAQEGAVGTHLLEYDQVSPCLMFGTGGRLRIDEYDLSAKAGWGLALATLGK